MGYHVTVERTDDGFVARNNRGATITFGTGGDDTDFTPIELLLAALGGCDIVTIEPLTAKRGHRLTRLAARISADKIKVNQLGTILVRYDVEFPPGDPDAPQLFHDVAERVHERMCAVKTALTTVSPVEVQF